MRQYRRIEVIRGVTCRNGENSLSGEEIREGLFDVLMTKCVTVCWKRRKVNTPDSSSYYIVCKNLHIVASKKQFRGSSRL